MHRKIKCQIQEIKTKTMRISGLLQQKKVLMAIVFFCFLGVGYNVAAQEVKESIEIIESSIKDNTYYDFNISGDGFLTYNWGNNEDNQTTISIDLKGVTISKDYTSSSPKVWINCQFGEECIEEQGRIGSRDGMYFSYQRTYLPANNEQDMNALFMHLSYLINFAVGR